MSYILHIDTATEKGFIAVAKDGALLHTLTNESQQDHAAFLQPAIQQTMRYLSLSLHDMDAIAVNAGPGSYTGLRVGLASAKGICFALSKPLIAINGLYMMANAVNMELDKNIYTDYFICPMTDARRMEVYAAVYDMALNEVLPPQAIVLKPETFKEIIKELPAFFTGNGAEKFLSITKESSYNYLQLPALHTAMCTIAYQYYLLKRFANLAYSEPFYLKPFFEKT